jgi:hypothetical protein
VLVLLKDAVDVIELYPAILVCLVTNWQKIKKPFFGCFAVML